MYQIDVILYPLIPALILLHLFIAPYTKVEESFNIQAIHDITTFGIPSQNISSILSPNYDHFEFSGAVPRTFVGALTLAGISKPIIHFLGSNHAQSVVRAALGLFNGVALLRFKAGLEKAFGKNVGRWYVLLQASQFHVMFYASRTLPNMYAFGLTTLAFVQLIPTSKPVSKDEVARKHKLAIFFLVFSGIVFRSEIALLLFTQLAYLLAQSRISLQTIVRTGVLSAVVALATSIPIDSFFWQKPIWPELAGFYYNAIQGKSADWGTSPITYYFTSLLPRLLLNPVIICLIPAALLIPAIRHYARDLVLPSILFVVIYSLQPHKESRFIIYVVPPLTAVSALAASYIWARRSKNSLYLLATFILAASIAGSFVASTGMLLISSLNYPGGDALAQLHDVIRKSPLSEDTSLTPKISVHMDVLSCMTGVTRFQELPRQSGQPPHHYTINDRQLILHYDKTEDPEQLLRPEFWAQFDYLLMENPEQAIGSWQVVESVYAYAGIEMLRPGDGSSFSENLEKVYAANNITKQKDGKDAAPDSEDVQEALKEGKGLDQELTNDKDEGIRSSDELRARLLLEQLSKFGTYKLVRDAVRQVTGGWWIGPRMEPKIRILKKVKR